MAPNRKPKEELSKTSLVVRKIFLVEGVHRHGGAWKVAYADFVTAMMAFFLLMWLLNATTEEKRRGIADYFSARNSIADSASGSGQPFGGLTPMDDGAMVSDAGIVQVTAGAHPIASDQPDSDAPQTARRPSDLADGSADATSQDGAQSATLPGTDSGSQPGGQPRMAGAGQSTHASDDATALNDRGPTYVASLSASGGASTQKMARGQTTATEMTEAAFRAEQVRHEKQAFRRAAQQIRNAIQADPALTDLGHQLAMDMTPEGLRIQIMDSDQRAMFASGSATMDERAKLLLSKVVPVLMKLPESISISGYTDAAPFPGPGRTNWDLSADRANTTRRLLTEDGLPEARIRSVTGNAERDPLVPSDPLSPRNRRIAIVVLNAGGPAATQPSATAAIK